MFDPSPATSVDLRLVPVLSNRTGSPCDLRTLTALKSPCCAYKRVRQAREQELSIHVRPDIIHLHRLFLQTLVLSLVQPGDFFSETTGVQGEDSEFRAECDDCSRDFTLISIPLGGSFCRERNRNKRTEARGVINLQTTT